jgi:hypothetical protein
VSTAGAQRALCAGNMVAACPTSRPTPAHHGAILRGVIVGPLTPTMRAAQVYNVQLEGAVRSVLTQVPLAAPAGMVSFNGTTYLAHLSEGDQVLVGFNGSTQKPVILCSLCTNSRPFKTDNVPNQKTNRDNYVQPPGSAFKDFLPSWIYLGKVFGQIAPYEGLTLEENQTNPGTTAGTRMPGVFNLYTFTGDRLEYTPGVTYRMSVGSVMDHIPGIAKRTVEKAVQLQKGAVEEAERLVQSVLGAGTNRGPEPDTSGTRLGPYHQEKVNITAKQVQESALIQSVQTRYVAEIGEATSRWERLWEQRVLEPALQMVEQWQPQGEFGVFKFDEQPFDLQAGLRLRELPPGMLELGNELPTVLRTYLPPIVRSDDPKAQGGKKALDGVVGLVRAGLPLLKTAQSFASRLAAAARKRGRGDEAARQALATVLDYYRLPFAPELVPVVEELGTRPVNLLTVLDFYKWLGDKRLSLAASAFILLLAPSLLLQVMEDLRVIWQELDHEGELPFYVVEQLERVAKEGWAALSELLVILDVPPPDVNSICEHPWLVGGWFRHIDPLFADMAEAWRRGNVSQALLAVVQFGQGMDWQATPNEREAVQELLRSLTRNYRWQ